MKIIVEGMTTNYRKANYAYEESDWSLEIKYTEVYKHYKNNCSDAFSVVLRAF